MVSVVVSDCVLNVKSKGLSEPSYKGEGSDKGSGSGSGSGSG